MNLDSTGFYIIQLGKNQPNQLYVTEDFNVVFDCKQKVSFSLNVSANFMKNQLPDYVARWQHGYQLCFSNFYLVKNHKSANNLTTTEARETYVQISNP